MSESNWEPGQFKPLPGMRDQGSEEYEALGEAQQRLQDLLASYGYEVINPPVLEPADLYLRRSGGELSSKLYSFTDRGGEKIGLRPEFTASAIRFFLSREKTLPLPVRWQYAGPVFRYEATPGWGYRQFHQLGAELIGSADARADCEVLSLAWGVLSQLGIPGCKLVVSHVGVVDDLLRALQISDGMRLFLLESLPEVSKGGNSLEQVKERARERGLLQDPAGKVQWESIFRGLGEEGARSLINELVHGLGEGAVGSRSPTEVVDRFLQRMRGADEPQRLEKAFQLAAGLTGIRGEPAHARRGIRTLAKEFKLDASLFKPLADVLALIEEGVHGDMPVSIDFGFTRGIGYYSGLIFNIYHGEPSEGAAIGGGGRYDGLVRSLGGAREVPAIGFAFNLERLLDIIALGGAPQKKKSVPERVLVVPESLEAHNEALSAAADLRAKGLVVEMEVNDRHLDESLRYARSRGIRRVMRVDKGGKVVEMNSREKVRR